MLRYRMSANGAWLGNMHAITQRLPANTRGPPLLVPFPEITVRLLLKSTKDQIIGFQSNQQHTQSRNSQAPSIHRNLLTTFEMHHFVLNRYRRKRKESVNVSSGITGMYELVVLSRTPVVVRSLFILFYIGLKYTMG